MMTQTEIGLLQALVNHIGKNPRALPPDIKLALANARSLLDTGKSTPLPASAEDLEPQPHLPIKSLLNIDDDDAKLEDNMIHVGGTVSNETVNIDLDKPMLCAELTSDEAKQLGAALIFTADELPKAIEAMAADREAYEADRAKAEADRE